MVDADNSDAYRVARDVSQMGRSPDRCVRGLRAHTPLRHTEMLIKSFSAPPHVSTNQIAGRL